MRCAPPPRAAPLASMQSSCANHLSFPIREEAREPRNALFQLRLVDRVGEAHMRRRTMRAEIDARRDGHARTLQHTVTVHDPRTYTQDWMNVRTWRLKPASDVIMEYSCEENNKSLWEGRIKPPKPPTKP